MYQQTEKYKQLLEEATEALKKFVNYCSPNCVLGMSTTEMQEDIISFYRGEKLKALVKEFNEILADEAQEMKALNTVGTTDGKKRRRKHD